MRPVYLLIEEINRELLSRILIGHAAVELGHPVVIGQQWWLVDNLHCLEPGTILFKGNNRYQAAYMGQAKRFEHATASIDEESFVSSSSLEISAQYHASAAEHCDRILVQGDFQRSVVNEKLPNAGDRLVLTGNPRADILGNPAFTPVDPIVEEYREAHGDYILVNTNFTKINPRDGDTYEYFELCWRTGVLDLPGVKPVDWFLGGCKWERENIRALVALIRQLRERAPTYRIVIRPHPSERAATWLKRFADMEGVDIITGGDHLAWIRQALVLVHSGCTTGLEAFLMGCPAVSMSPGDKWWDTGVLSSVVNDIAETPEEALTIVLDLIAGSERTISRATERRAALSTFLRLDEHESSATRIAKVLGALAEDTRPRPAQAANATPIDRPQSQRMERKAFVTEDQFRRRLSEVEKCIGAGTQLSFRALGPSVYQLSDRHGAFATVI